MAIISNPDTTQNPSAPEQTAALRKHIALLEEMQEYAEDTFHNYFERERVLQATIAYASASDELRKARKDLVNQQKTISNDTPRF